MTVLEEHTYLYTTLWMPNVLYSILPTAPVNLSQKPTPVSVPKGALTLRFPRIRDVPCILVLMSTSVSGLNLCMFFTSIEVS